MQVNVTNIIIFRILFLIHFDSHYFSNGYRKIGSLALLQETAFSELKNNWIALSLWFY